MDNSIETASNLKKKRKKNTTTQGYRLQIKCNDFTKKSVDQKSHAV